MELGAAPRVAAVSLTLLLGTKSRRLGAAVGLVVEGFVLLCFDVANGSLSVDCAIAGPAITSAIETRSDRAALRCIAKLQSGGKRNLLLLGAQSHSCGLVTSAAIGYSGLRLVFGGPHRSGLRRLTFS